MLEGEFLYVRVIDGQYCYQYPAALSEPYTWRIVVRF
jgi:hypothetical protein